MEKLTLTPLSPLFAAQSPKTQLLKTRTSQRVACQLRSHQAAEERSIKIGPSAVRNGNMTSTNHSSNDNDNEDHYAQKAIASTAGQDSWKTWAGRKDGSEDFEFLDIFRGMKRSLHHNLRTNSPTPGTTCPICFCEPDDCSEWHVTWCGHGVCKTCLAQYASTQVKDREQSGPLKCPVCLKSLRKKDAIVAMMAGGNKAELLEEWDVKLRDQLLRAVRSFRSCPKCGDRGGGGFVSPECLAPHHQERRDNATRILLHRNLGLLVILLAYFSLAGYIVSNASRSLYLDLYAMLLPIYVFVKMGMAMQYWLASMAREALFRPLPVGCPCCDEVFALPGESADFTDEESSRWMKANTRPCPSCSVPIVKRSGCNHMRCSHCKADFCWACMRLRTNCRAYECNHGARYGNAPILEAREEEQERQQALQSDGSILTYIDHILNHRICPDLHYGDGVLILACLVGRHLGVVVYLERMITPILMDVILPAFVYFFTPAFMVLWAFLHMRQNNNVYDPRHHVPRRHVPRRNNNNNNGANAVLIETLNQNMLNEALQRSIEET